MCNLITGNPFTSGPPNTNPSNPNTKPPSGNPFLSGLFGKGNNNPPSPSDNKGNPSPSNKPGENIPQRSGTNTPIGEGNPFLSALFNKGNSGNSQNRVVRNDRNSEENPNLGKDLDQKPSNPFSNSPSIATFGPFNVARTSPPSPFFGT